MHDLTDFHVDFDYPSVVIPYNFFTFTGRFYVAKRKECEDEVVKRGGILKPKHLNRLANYLVIGSGLYEFKAENISISMRKIESALAMKAEGINVSIISEHHFVENMKNIKPPSINCVTVKSFGGSDATYEVSLKELTCTCPNFVEDRAEYLISDPIRLCKHLVKSLVEAYYVPVGLHPFVEKIAVAYAYSGGIPGFKGNPYIAY